MRRLVSDPTGYLINFVIRIFQQLGRIIHSNLQQIVAQIGPCLLLIYFGQIGRVQANLPRYRLKGQLLLQVVIDIPVNPANK
ncbi:hypothetical protein D3C78_1705990 [compost metagenome]